MAIYHKTTVRRALSAVDLRDCEGMAVVKDENGQLKLSTGPRPLGVVHVGGNAGEFTDYILPGFSGIIGVRLDETSYPVKEGDLLESYAGCFKRMATSGESDAVAMAAEDGEPGEIIEAVLITPVRSTQHNISPMALNLDAAEPIAPAANAEPDATVDAKPVAVSTAKTTTKKTTKA